MYPTTAILVGSILAVAATVALFVLVLPKRKDGHLEKYLQMLYDIFTFKHLFVEKILQVLYVLSTCLAVFIGFFLIFARTWCWRYSASTALYGLCLMILGPIVLRVLYELLMLAVLQVKNTMEINRKLGKSPQGSGVASPMEKPAPAPPEEPERNVREETPSFQARAPEERQTSRPMAGMRHCPSCGTWYQASRDICPICGTKGSVEEK